MGRHSAAEDEDHEDDLLDLLTPEQSAEAAASAPAPLRASGRHAIADESESEPERFAVSDRGEPRRVGGTRADLRLVRRNRALLARCIAAVIVPFVLYSVVLELLGKGADYLLLIWIPAIVAGVLLGSFLDAAHRRSAAETGRA